MQWSYKRNTKCEDLWVFSFNEGCELNSFKILFFSYCDVSSPFQKRRHIFLSELSPCNFDVWNSWRTAPLNIIRLSKDFCDTFLFVFLLLLLLSLQYRYKFHGAFSWILLLNIIVKYCMTVKIFLVWNSSRTLWDQWEILLHFLYAEQGRDFRVLPKYNDRWVYWLLFDQIHDWCGQREYH